MYITYYTLMIDMYDINKIVNSTYIINDILTRLLYTFIDFSGLQIA